MFKKLLVFVLALLVCLAGAADKFDQQVASIILLQLKPVQAELGVTAAQRTSMNKYADSHRASLKTYYESLSKAKANEPDKAKLERMFTALKTAVLAQLNDAQIKRLREISLQELGFSALADDTVATRVGLSGAQLTKLRKVLSDGLSKASQIEYKAVTAATKGIQGQTPKSAADRDRLVKLANEKASAAEKSVHPQVMRVRDETSAKVLAVLTPQQRSNWKALQGKPFKLP